MTCRQSGQLHRPVVVAVIAVRMMEVSVHEIVNVVAVRYGFVPAPRSVDVSRLMAAAVRRALVRILCADLDLMLIHMTAMWMV